MRWNGWGMGWNNWGMGFTWLFWVIVLVAVVALIFFIMQRSSTPSKKSAEEILKERFARGEISKEEYEERLKSLRS
jgi:putative membrane protein